MASESAREFRKNESWLFDSTAGTVLRVTALVVTTLLLALFILFPLYWMVVTAFKTTAEIQQIPPTIIPVEPSIQGFILVFESSLHGSGYGAIFESLFGWDISSAIDIDVLLLIYNSLIVAIGAGLIALAFGTLGSYVLSRRDFAGKNLVLSLLLASLMFPGAAIMVPMWQLIGTLNLFNTRTALVLVYGAMTAPFVVWLMKGFFDEFPQSIIDAAQMDQCTPYETFRYVIIPMSLNTLIASFIFAFLLAWNELVFALTLLESGKFTVPPGLLTFVQGFNIQWNVVAATSILVSLPVLLGLAYIQRYFVQGLTGGAIKG